MARPLTQLIEDQLEDQQVEPTYTFLINDVDRSDFVQSWNISIDRRFGSSSATFTLLNNDGIFGEGGALQINVGDTVQLIENFAGDTSDWKRFFGVVVQRSIVKGNTRREITLACLDFISTLQFLDINLDVEGIKVEVENEVLAPQFLPAPTDTLAQVFNFSKDGLSENPRPIILIRDNTNELDNPQFDGFDINFQQGQLKLGSPLSAAGNYDIVARSYHYYVAGVFAEDVLEAILTQVDGYGKFLFGETSAQAVIDNHLTDTLLNVEATSTDELIPNFLSTELEIRHTLAVAVTANDTSITLDSTEGFPNNGQAEINGDIFTWTSRTATVLSGIPPLGNNALKAHAIGDLVIFERTYAPGQVWSLTFSNITSNLTAADFTIPLGGVFNFFDKRFGRIILTAPISTAAFVTSDTNYTFKTLQASGIELNRITFFPREITNRFAAIQKLRKFLSPSYVIRTQGDDKILSSFVGQKTEADYNLELIQDIGYLEDEDLITRVVLFGKHDNPTNLMFNDSVNFNTTGESFKAIASNLELQLLRDEGAYFVYGPDTPGIGFIDLEVIQPVIFINNIAIDNTLHLLPQNPVVVQLTTQTETRSGCHGISKETYVKQHTYFYFKVFLSHTSISPDNPITFFDATGTAVQTLAPQDLNMDYARGVWHVPGDTDNPIIQSISTASYHVLYSTSDLIIDYDKVEFKIHKSIIPNPEEFTVSGTFEFWNIFTQVFDIAAVIDGRFDTQVQTEFFSEPPSGFPLAIIDLGQIEAIQAIDIVAGFYQPDVNRKFDIDMRISLRSSDNGVDFFDISDATSNIKLSGGEAIQLGQVELGEDFETRFLMLVIQHVKKIDFGKGVWVVAFTEISAYNNIIIKSEAKLIPTTLSQNIISPPGPVTLNVLTTDGFASSGTAFIADDGFTYTGITATSFLGVSGFTTTHADQALVHQTQESDTDILDPDAILPKLGDRVFKNNLISDELLFNEEQLNNLAKQFLREFYKDHTKRRVRVRYSPYIQIGQTVELTDSFNNVFQERFFVESVSDQSGAMELVIAKYAS